MAGFRNIAVHDYQTLNPAILQKIVVKHLSVFRDFTKQVKKAAKHSWPGVRAFLNMNHMHSAMIRSDNRPQKR
ncbi:hypothetical protein BTO30_01500 [Domibacillus antri]|uniref:DUF86 domain-containing protein n=1 Tax=Domibacillus antri TaxID=1714264 RepID=A0A1Q8Q9T9_9BACI|nr:hypothetical protein BTO30_01500 [Domibacillus antri]